MGFSHVAMEETPKTGVPVTFLFVPVRQDIQGYTKSAKASTLGSIKKDDVSIEIKDLHPLVNLITVFGTS